MRHGTIAAIAAAIALAAELSPGPALASPPPGGSWEQYLAVKSAVQQSFGAQTGSDWMNEPIGWNIHAPSSTHAGPLVNLGSCFESEELTGRRGGQETAAFVDVAYDIVTWRWQLAHSGYPVGFWRPALRAYEREAVDVAIASPKRYFRDYDRYNGTAEPEDDRPARFKHARSLMHSLNAYRARHPTLPVAIDEPPGCGGANPTVTFATIPLGGQVMFIPTFFYALCKAEKQNPDDPTVCPQWREALEGKLEMVAGEYRYRVRWPDGATRVGKLNFATLGHDYSNTITLRKP